MDFDFRWVDLFRLWPEGERLTCISFQNTTATVNKVFFYHVNTLRVRCGSLWLHVYMRGAHIYSLVVFGGNIMIIKPC